MKDVLIGVGLMLWYLALALVVLFWVGRFRNRRSDKECRRTGHRWKRFELGDHVWKSCRRCHKRRFVAHQGCHIGCWGGPS